MARRLEFFLCRLPSLSREEFQDYWRTKHGPLVAERAEVLGIRRYQQVHTTRAGRVDTFDGVAELWIDPTPASPERDQASLELLEDERNFIDHSASPIFMVDDMVINEGRIEGDRMTAAMHRRPDMSRAEFQRYWHDVHGRFPVDHPELGFRHYEQLHTTADAESFPTALARGVPPPFDGVSIVYRDTWPGDPEQAAAVRQMVLEDEPRFMAADSPMTWYGRVEVVIAG